MMKIQGSDFHFELAKVNQRELIHQWIEQAHVREILDELKLKNTLGHLDKFFKGKSQYTYCIGYYKIDPFIFMISTKKRHSVSVDFIICDPNYLEKGLLIPLIREFRSSKYHPVY